MYNNNEQVKIDVEPVTSLEGINFRRMLWGGSNVKEFSLEDIFCQDQTYRQSIVAEKRSFPCVIIYTDKNDERRYLVVNRVK